MYEFTDQENGVISKSAQSSMMLGILLIITGVARFCSFSWIIAAGEILVFIGIYRISDITMGIILLVATGALKAVTTSQGQDVQHMSKAVGLIGTMFIVRVAVTAILILWELGVTAYLLFVALFVG